jgi:hypothetical protein
MTRNQEELLKTAIEAIRKDEPSARQMSAAAGKVADSLGLDTNSMVSVSPGAGAQSDPIQSCEDVQGLLVAYRSGTLSDARALVIEAHLRDCSACLLRFKNASEAKVLDWSTPRVKTFAGARPRKLGWAFGSSIAAGIALAVASLFAYKAYWQVPPGVRAQVISIEGTAYGISDAGDRLMVPGDELREGDHLRTGGGAHAVIKLADGSTVEVNERSNLGVGARGRSMTISLDNGAVIVQAAKRDSGHLYVNTPDCRVAVTGTVFSVNSGIKGSRVAVLQGTVDVSHAGQDTKVKAGDQLSTNDNLTAAPVADQISWSHDRGQYLPLLAELSLLQNKIEQIPFPQPRYTSDLMSRVPSDTVLYISIPNLGDFISQANKIFDDQLKQSPVLQQWWSKDGNHNTAELDSLVDRLHEGSQYLGAEIVVVGVKQADKSSFAVVADLQKSGFDDFLKRQIPVSKSGSGLTILNDASLKAASASTKDEFGVFALIRTHEVVFSNSLATLKQMNAQLDATAGGFASGPFGQQISAAYGRGAGVILAADVHQMVGAKIKMVSGSKAGDAIGESGVGDVQYLIAEHREVNGKPENHLNVQFSGNRQRVASWLAAPAPLGSLDFVTPNASVAIALLTKDPKSIADDILSMATTGDPNGKKDLDGAQAAFQVNLRDDLAANFGGDFLVSLDGPVLPTPSWKAVAEVNNPEQLEKALERISKQVSQMGQGKDFKGIAIEPSDAGGQRFYAVRNVSSGIILAQYTFSDGYMILAANRPLLMEALHAHTSGDSLARSAAFKSLLPRDQNDNYSAVAYQNLSPVMGPMLAQMGGEQAAALRQLTADAKPTAICAWGKDRGIEIASDSHLLGFDFVALGALFHGGNNPAPQSVKN